MKEGKESINSVLASFDGSDLAFLSGSLRFWTWGFGMVTVCVPLPLFLSLVEGAGGGFAMKGILREGSSPGKIMKKEKFTKRIMIKVCEKKNHERTTNRNQTSR